MADFARVGELVAQLEGFASGWFVDSYQEMLESAAADNSEGDPVFNFVEGDLTRRFAKKSWASRSAPRSRSRLPSSTHV